MTQCVLCKAEDAVPVAVSPKDVEVALCATLLRRR